MQLFSSMLKTYLLLGSWSTNKEIANNSIYDISVWILWHAEEKNVSLASLYKEKTANLMHSNIPSYGLLLREVIKFGQNSC